MRSPHSLSFFERPLCGGQMLGLVPNSILLPILAALLASAIKVWRHEYLGT